MASFSLDDIRKAADAQYGSTDITLDDGFTVKLLNPLRLSKEKRKALMDVQKEMDLPDDAEAVEVDQEAHLANSIKLIADTQTGAERLLASVDGDLAMLVTIFKSYSEGTQAGEASGSQS